MKRVIFIVVGTFILWALSTLKKNPLAEKVETIKGVRCFGGSYKAIVASFKNAPERVILMPAGESVAMAFDRNGNGGYEISYASPGGPRIEPLTDPVSTLDTARGLRTVPYSGTLPDLMSQIRNGSELPLSMEAAQPWRPAHP